MAHETRTGRCLIDWLDELAMHIVEGRADEALLMLHDEYPEQMPSIQVVRLLSAVRKGEGGVITLRPIATAPKEVGKDVLVFYDHDADPCQDPHDENRLTDYAAWAEGGTFMDGRGWCIAAWQDRHWESTGEYGEGYWMPAAWFARQNDDYEAVVNPTHWMPLPEEPTS